MVKQLPYQPEKGDLVWLDFTPYAGTEQGGRRPALVLSPLRFNVATGLAFVCPITSQVKGGSFEVALPGGGKISGVVLADHLRSLDWLARNITFDYAAPRQLVIEVMARLEAILNFDELM
jgi:mRNA interferase MazF